MVEHDLVSARRANHIPHVAQLRPGTGIQDHDTVGRNIFWLDIFAQESAIKRLNEIEEVSAVATLLASDAGAGITGSLISIDGGTAPY